MEESLYCYREALRRRPSTPPHTVDPLPPSVLDPLAWREPSRGKQPKALPEQKVFLPLISDWLEWPLAAHPAFDPFTENVEFVSEQLSELVKEIPERFREQRNYLLENEQALELTTKDTWPLERAVFAKFVANSMAGARWGLNPSSSRLYASKERRRSGKKPRLRLEGSDVVWFVEKRFLDPGPWWNEEIDPEELVELKGYDPSRGRSP